MIADCCDADRFENIRKNAFTTVINLAPIAPRIAVRLSRPIIATPLDGIQPFDSQEGESGFIQLLNDDLSQLIIKNSAGYYRNQANR